MKTQTLFKFLNISRKNNNSSGFTLIELLIAAAISSLIIGVAGWGLVTLMGSKKASDSQSDKQGEINRASDFINDEIRKAKFINKEDTIDAINNGTYSVAGNLFDNGSKTVVLALQIPDGADNNTDDETVIYYVQDNNATWRGPQVIYRWGPIFDAQGGYSVNAAGDFTYQADGLIDGINNTDIDSISCLDPNVPDKTPNITNSKSGLYACLGGMKYNNNNNTEKYYTTAQLYINGVFQKATDNATQYSGASDGSTQTASRINDAPGNILSTLNVPSYKPSVALQARFLCRKIDNTDVPWRVRTTISIDGFTFSYLEGEPIDNLTNLIRGTANKTPDYEPTGKTLSDYKLSSNGSTLKVEKKDSGSPTGYVEVTGTDAFKVTVEPYIVKDANGDFVRLDPDGSLITIDKDTGATTPTNVDGTSPVPTTSNLNPNTTDDIANFQAGCDNSKGNLMSVNSVDHPNQAVTLANNPITNQGVKFPPDNAVYSENVLQGFNDDRSTVDVLRDKGYLESTTTSTTNSLGQTETKTTYETSLEKDEMVFLFEIGHDNTKDPNDPNKMNTGFDLQDKAVVLSW
jgi:prepilin-type N-terminal cleavage/methylation domain-containing protein